MTTLGALAVGGLGVGTAFAAGQAAHSPDDLSAIESEAVLEPGYETNAASETYGSAAFASSPEEEPDLIRVYATNGKIGYAKKAELDLADGTTAALSFTSPEDALRWQETEGQLDHSVPVYEADGATVIGEFIVYGQKSVAEQAAQLGLDDN